MAIKLGNGKWAVKENNLLAYNDNSGKFFNKEFDFTRGSSATYVGKDGLIKTAGLQDTDLVQNGDFSTDSNWSKGTGWIIENGALRLTTTSTDNTSQAIGLVQNNFYNITFTVSNTTLGGVRIRLGVGALSGVYTNGTHTIQLQQTTTNDAFRIYSDSSGVFNGTVDDVSVKEIQVNTPRIDFSDSVDGALLLEPSRTNLIQYSENVSNSYWGKYLGATVESEKVISPKGKIDAYQITYNGTTNGRIEKAVSVTSGAAYTFSFYARVSSGTQDFIYGHYQSQNGTLTTDWQRFVITQNENDATSYPRIICNDVATIEVYAIQLEQGSYPTSYIPTQGSSSTRIAETCNNSGTAQDINSEEGVLYAEISALADDLVPEGISISDGTIGNRVVIFKWTTTNSIKVRVTSGGTNYFDKTISVSDITTINKIAIKYKQNDFALWVNGIELETDTSGITPIGLSKLNFNGATSPSPFYGKTKELQVFTEALSDEELEYITSYRSLNELVTTLKLNKL